MRNLTIRRTKTYVACLAKMKVYIEDYVNGDTTINNVPCRKLGDLKNGEEKTFVIGDEPAKVFVVADKLSKNLSNEFVNIPAGTEDIFLSGKNWYNPANGNAFRFDGAVDEDVLKNRKKGTKKGIIVIIIAAIIGFIIGIAGTMNDDVEVAPEVFASNGMEITLTNEFTETSVDGYTVCYGSQNVAVFALKEDFALFEGAKEYTLAEYGEMVVDSNGFSSDVELQTVDGLSCFEYEWTNPETNIEYKYLSVVYKTTNAFWLIQFSTTADNYDSCYADFLQWAKSVEFTAG